MKESLSQRDRKVIWHPYTPQKYAPDPLPIVKGEGVYLIDELGRRYIDAISSWWVTIHGHAHPYIAEAVFRQASTLEQVIFAGFTHPPAIELAERLLPLLPGNLAKIFYSDNGSTATEVAIKMAIQYWWNKNDKKRSRIIAFNHSYHGDTFGAMSISSRGLFTLAFQDRLFDVLFTDPPSAGAAIRFEGFPEDQTNQLLDETACVIYEPLLQGAGGMNMYEAAALDAFLVRCKEHGVLCIADEVMTGFGRTGKLFASSHCSLSPDIVCLSKGLTGGTMAMGITACSDIIYQAFVDEDKMKSLFHGHSFTANPIACAAALASLDLLEKPGCAAGIQAIAGHHASFTAQLEARAEEFSVKNIRQLGTIMAFEVNDDREGYLSPVRDLFISEGLKQGVYLRPLGNTVYLMPPYCITGPELQQTYRVIEEILSNRKVIG